MNLTSARKAIHVKRRQLGMEDADYRAMLGRVANVESSTALTAGTAWDVLREMDRLGAPVRAPRPVGRGGSRTAPTKAQNDEWRFTFRAAAHLQPYLKKIYVLAVKIGEKQTPPVPVMSKAWVEGTVKQCSGINGTPGRDWTVKPLEMCDADELHLVIQILAEHLRKRGGRP
jgi:phage gp16-like protein